MLNQFVILVSYFLFGVLTVYTGTVIIATDYFTKKVVPVFDYMVDKWAHATLWLATITVTIHHLGDKDDDRQCVIVSNHECFFDTPIAMVSLPQRFIFLIKSGYMKIPVFGKALEKGGCVPVFDSVKATRNMRSVFRAMKDLARTGRSIFFFPEGTRSEDGELGEFEIGAFAIAERFGLPILPIAIFGSREILPKGEFLMKRHVHVHVCVGRYIESKEREPAELLDEARIQIVEMREMLAELA